jgi:membrane-associated phospholipid phosphatase
MIAEVTAMHEPPVRRRSPYFRHLVILCLAGAVAFAGLTLAVAGSESFTHLDTTVAEACHRHATESPGTVRFFQIVTWFGTFRALTALSIVAIITIAHVGRRRLALAWLLTLVGSGLAIEAMKEVFERPRPVWDQPFALEESFSYPSGHASGSTVGYGMLAYCVALRWKSWRRRLGLVTGLAAWVLLIGFSRIYLGVHYLSDVLAGYALGLAWLALCIVTIEEVRVRL